MTDRLIIIGAPRSGTNMLRDLICTLPGFGTWPCDEINFIWRHGNIDYPSDALPPELATADVQRFVHARFDALARSRNLRTVVEKTCANSLRVDFVERILPRAKYVFVTRNGMDAVASAVRRWRAPLDLRYTLRKARFVPLADVPAYATRFVANRLARLFSNERRLGRWGPWLAGMDEMLAKQSLEEVCAFQWRACVASATRALNALDAERVLRVRYEDVVADPRSVLADVARLAGAEPRDLDASDYGWITAGRVGAGGDALHGDVRARVESIVAGVDTSPGARSHARSPNSVQAYETGYEGQSSV